MILDETKTFEREVLERLIKIETKLESWDASKAQIYENQRNILTLKEQSKQQETEIVEMQDKFKWLNRTTWGAIITALVAIIVRFI